MHGKIGEVLIIKKKRRPLPGLIRINCDPEENNLALAHLELKEIEDKGLFCNTCCDERIATLQSFCELKQHIIAKHLNLFVEGNFIIVKNTPANPVSQQFTYYPCTKCGKCFFQSSPQEKLKTHSNQECNNSHDYEEDNYETPIGQPIDRQINEPPMFIQKLQKNQQISTGSKTSILQNSNILKMDQETSMFLKGNIINETSPPPDAQFSDGYSASLPENKSPAVFSSSIQHMLHQKTM